MAGAVQSSNKTPICQLRKWLLHRDQELLNELGRPQSWVIQARSSCSSCAKTVSTFDVENLSHWAKVAKPRVSPTGVLELQRTQIQTTRGSKNDISPSLTHMNQRRPILLD